MKVLQSIVLAMLLFPAWGFAAFEAGLPGARAAALGGSALALRGDIVAGTINPAGLVGLRGLGVTAWSTPSLYGIEGLARMGLSAGLPIGPFPVAVSVSTLGLRGYQETSLAIGAAFPIGNAWAAGLRVRLNVLAIGGYGQASVPSLDVALSCDLAPGCDLSVLLTNALAARIGAAGETLPVSLEFGCSVTPGDAGATLYARCCKELLSPLEWSFGTAYCVVPELVLRLGVSSEPSLLCCGAGIALAPVMVEYGLTHHRLLGQTHTMSVSLNLD